MGTNIAKIARARTAPTKQRRVTTALAVSVKIVNHQIGKVMATATTATTTVVVIGMAVTAAVPKISSSAKNANVWTVHTKQRVMIASLSSRRPAEPPSSRAMDTAMTTTTLPGAIGTVVTVVETRRTSNIAKSATAWTVLKKARTVAPAVRKAANLPNTKMT